jgi:hypothetical protein
MEQLTSNSRAQPMVNWVLNCGKHQRLMQPLSLLKSMARHGGIPTCLHCWQCQQQDALPEHVRDFVRVPSMFELCTYAALHSLQRGGAFEMPSFQCEVKLVRGCGALDIWVPQWGLGIMVDGQHHFPGGRHHSSSCSEQDERDATFNEAVLAGHGLPWVHGVLRLHWRDVESCGMWVSLAAQHTIACRAKTQRFVLSSWGRKLQLS